MSDPSSDTSQDSLAPGALPWPPHFGRLDKRSALRDAILSVLRPQPSTAEIETFYGRQLRLRSHFEASAFREAFEGLVVAHDEVSIRKFILHVALRLPERIHDLDEILDSKPSPTDDPYVDFVTHVANRLDTLCFPNGPALAQWFIDTFTPSMADTSTAVGSTSEQPYMDFLSLSWNGMNGGNQGSSTHTEIQIDREQTPRPESYASSASGRSDAATTAPSAPSDVHSAGPR